MTAQGSENLFDLRGKVALITGGSRGLGRAIAEGFARAGADIAIVSRKLVSCEAAAKEIRKLDVRAFAHACHVGHWNEIEPTVDAVTAHFGKIDILVNNAGMSPLYPSLEDVSEELFDKVVGVNMKGPFRLSALVAGKMNHGAGGSIINISSTGSLNPRAASAPYGAAKAALNALTTAFAQGYWPKVRVNAILPGPFSTDVADHWSDPPDPADRSKTLGGKRIGAPDEIVTTALYLASEHSSFTSGTLIRLDGAGRAGG